MLKETFNSRFSQSSKSTESDDMQKISLNNTNVINNTSPKCKLTEEIKILSQQLAELNQTVVELETTIQIKDSQVDKIRRDNERLLQELKRQQRSNRNIKQQLDDERSFYQKEKEHFYEELQNYKEKYSGSISKFHRLEYERIKSLLEEENKKLKNELIGKSQTTYNLCVKFLRMKMAKDSIRKNLDHLTMEHLQVMSEMMEKLDEAREELNIIVSEKFQDPLPMDKLKYLQIVKRNSRLVHENATLNLQIQHLIQTVDKFKNDSEKSKAGNIDPKTIEKLIERNRESRHKHKSGITLRSPSKDKIETRRYSNMETCRTVDQSGDANLVSKLHEKHCNQLLEMEKEFSKSNHDQLFIGSETSCTQSAPAIVQSSTFDQYHFILKDGVIFERNLKVRDMETTT